jgi:hypothetical protein
MGTCGRLSLAGGVTIHLPIWEAHDWSVPINFMVANLVNINKQPISLQAGLRYWAASRTTVPMVSACALP